jgi:hypothetical protein
MSGDDKDESFDLLAHEKKISELYQNNKKHQTVEPSTQIDSGIMAMAKQQISGNSSLLTKGQTLKQQPPDNKNTKTKTRNMSQKAWQWPFSLVASVGFLGVLLITQRDYFIHPKNIFVGDAGVLNAPVMRGPDISEAESFTEALATVQSFQAKKIAASAQKYEILLDKEVLLDKKLIAVERKIISISHTAKLLKEQMLDKSMLEGNSAKTSPMLLSEMSKLAELLKQELAIQNMSELQASASSLKMQQTLFEQLIQYQKSHADFIISEKYSSVLTDKQVQQVKSVATEAVSEN